MADVVFSAFDERTGPVAIFSTIKDEVLSKKIAVKSIVSTLTSVRGSSSEILEGEAIIPFPDEKKIAFIFYSTLKQKTTTGENRVISLSAIVNEQEKTGLYSNATVLSKNALEVKNALNNSYVFGQQLSSDLVNQMTNWGQIVKPIKVREIGIIAEEEIRIGIKSLFELFPSKRGFRSTSDPLIPLFAGLFIKVPVILVGPNLEFLLEIVDVLRGFMPNEELDVRLSISLHSQAVYHSISYGVPRADIVLLNEEQYKRATFYREPSIALLIGKEPKINNYQLPSVVEKVIGNIMKKTRSLKNETVCTHYLKGETLSFFSNLDKLKDICLSQRQGKLKDIARILDVNDDYLTILAEALWFRREVNADSINRMFLPTFPPSIGIVH
jgi:hypothetical protein